MSSQSLDVLSLRRDVQVAAETAVVCVGLCCAGRPSVKVVKSAKVAPGSYHRQPWIYFWITFLFAQPTRTAPSHCSHATLRIWAVAALARSSQFAGAWSSGDFLRRVCRSNRSLAFSLPNSIDALVRELGQFMSNSLEYSEFRAMAAKLRREAVYQHRTAAGKCKWRQLRGRGFRCSQVGCTVSLARAGRGKGCRQQES